MIIKSRQCPCMSRNCRDYHLVGIGKFTQGSGFTKEEAERICRLLNAEAEEARTVLEIDAGNLSGSVIALMIWICLGLVALFGWLLFKESIIHLLGS